MDPCYTSDLTDELRQRNFVDGTKVPTWIRLHGIPGCGKSSLLQDNRMLLEEHFQLFDISSDLFPDDYLNQFYVNPKQNALQLQVIGLRHFRDGLERLDKLLAQGAKADRGKPILVVEHTSLEMIHYFCLSFRKQKFLSNFNFDEINKQLKLILMKREQLQAGFRLLEFDYDVCYKVGVRNVSLREERKGEHGALLIDKEIFAETMRHVSDSHFENWSKRLDLLSLPYDSGFLPSQIFIGALKTRIISNTAKFFVSSLTSKAHGNETSTCFGEETFVEPMMNIGIVREKGSKRALHLSVGVPNGEPLNIVRGAENILLLPPESSADNNSGKRRKTE